MAVRLVCSQDKCAKTIILPRRKNRDKTIKKIVNVGKKCKIEGCEAGAEESQMCMRHYTQIRNYGKIFKTPFDRDYKIDKENRIVKINLWNRYGRLTGSTLIDLEDLERVKKYNWFITKQGYVKHNEAGGLHRYLLNLPKHRGEETVVDHIDNDRLNNRKSNLRIVHFLDNIFNRKIPVGVTYDKNRGMWRARVSMFGQFRISKKEAIEDRDRFLKWRKKNWNRSYPKRV